MRVAITGCSGKLGAFVTEKLRRRGHQVYGFDAVAPVRGGEATQVDLVDYGETVDALASIDGRHSGVDAIVHLAAVPAVGLASDVRTFHRNVSMTYNVLHASRQLGIRKVVYASSVVILGFPFTDPPAYLPLDEESPALPESAYALSKHVGEELCRQFARRDCDSHIVALRFSHVIGPDEYGGFDAHASDPGLRRPVLWGYVDVRDAATAVSLSLNRRGRGFEAFIIAAAETSMPQSSADLARAAFPDAPLRRPLAGREPLMSIDRARRVLGYDPEHAWRSAAATPT